MNQLKWTIWLVSFAVFINQTSMEDEMELDHYLTHHVKSINWMDETINNIHCCQDVIKKNCTNSDFQYCAISQTNKITKKLNKGYPSLTYSPCRSRLANAVSGESIASYRAED